MIQINHIAYIMDGNRRYSEKQKIDLKEGYKRGMEKVLEILEFHLRNKIKNASFFALSKENIEKREKKELKPIVELLEEFSKNEKIEKFIKENKIKIKVRGNLKELEEEKKDSLDIKEKGISEKKIKELKKELEKHNSSIEKEEITCNIAINYNGQEEILHSLKQIIKKGIKDPSLKDIKDNLYFNDIEAPEIIVRTGNVPRISGFMLFDSAYSEIYLTKKLWPELDKIELEKILQWYKGINRNFGK